LESLVLLIYITSFPETKLSLLLLFKDTLLQLEASSVQGGLFISAPLKKATTLFPHCQARRGSITSTWT